VEPVVNSSFGASMVAVTSICSDAESWVPQSAQKLADSGLADLHCGHLIDIAGPFIQAAKGYQGKIVVSTAGICFYKYPA
jgi:hypothetical protein